MILAGYELTGNAYIRGLLFAAEIVKKAADENPWCRDTLMELYRRLLGHAATTKAKLDAMKTYLAGDNEPPSRS